MTHPHREKIAVWGFRWAPPLRRGWCATFACRALEEAGLPYEAHLIGFEDLGSDAYRQRQLSTKEAIDMDVGWASTLDPSRYKPQMVTYGVRGYAWDHIDPALPKFDKMPPM